MTKTAIANRELDLKQQELDLEKKKFPGQMFKDFTSPFRLSARGNAANWYYISELLRDQVARLPMITNTGSLVDGLGFASPRAQGMTVYYADSIIDNNDLTASTLLNQSLIKLKNDLRSKNSRVGGLEPGDMGQILFAETSIHVLMAVAYKALAAARTYSNSQAYIGDAIILGLGVDPKDLRDNFAQYRDRYNLLAQRINANSYIPKTWSYYERKVFIASQVFSDDTIAQGQFIQFAPLGYYVYIEGSAQLQFKRRFYSGDLKNFYVLLQHVENALNPIQYSSAISEFHSDMLAGLGTEPGTYYQVALYDDEEIEFNHIDEVLHQVINCTLPPVFYNKATATAGTETGTMWIEAFDLSTGTLAGYSVDDGSNTLGSASLYFEEQFPLNDACLHINQSASGLLVQGNSTDKVPTIVNETSTTAGTMVFKVVDTTGRLHTDNFINWYKDNPTTDEIMVATRLTNSYAGAYNPSTSKIQLTIKGFGTEIPLFAKVHAYDAASKRIYSNWMTGLSYGSREAYFTTLRKLPVATVIGQFNWVPRFYFTTGSTNTSSMVPLVQLGNLMKYQLNAAYLLNSVAIQGLLAIRDVFKYNANFKVGKQIRNVGSGNNNPGKKFNKRSKKNKSGSNDPEKPQTK